MLSRSMHTAAQHVLLGWVQTVWQPVAPCRFVCLLLMKCMYMCVCFIEVGAALSRGWEGLRLPWQAAMPTAGAFLWGCGGVQFASPHLCFTEVLCEALLRQLVVGSTPCRHPHLPAPCSCRQSCLCSRGGWAAAQLGRL